MLFLLLLIVSSNANTLCPKGFGVIVDGGDTGCIECTLGEYSDVQDASQACQPQGTCAAGEGKDLWKKETKKVDGKDTEVKTLLTLSTTAAVGCVVCETGMFSAKDDNEACKAVKICGANEREKKAPTLSSDRECEKRPASSKTLVLVIVICGVLIVLSCVLAALCSKMGGPSDPQAV